VHGVPGGQRPFGHPVGAAGAAAPQPVPGGGDGRRGRPARGGAVLSAHPGPAAGGAAGGRRVVAPGAGGGRRPGGGRGREGGPPGTGPPLNTRRTPGHTALSPGPSAWSKMALGTGSLQGRGQKDGPSSKGLRTGTPGGKSLVLRVTRVIP